MFCPMTFETVLLFFSFASYLETKSILVIKKKHVVDQVQIDPLRDITDETLFILV